MTGASEEGPGQNDHANAGPSGPPDAEPDQRHEVGAGIELAPHPRDALPALSATEALRAFEHSWGILWRRYGSPDAALMAGRNQRESCCDAAHGETFASSFTDRLVWAFTWHHHPTEATIGPGASARDQREAAHARTAIVDAMTGDVLAVIEAFNPDVGS